MKTPLDIILERMRMYDPTEIIDMLNITTEELIARFNDRIDDRQDFLRQEFEIFVCTDDDDQDYDEDWTSLNDD